MALRRRGARRLKIHRNYSVEEAAGVLGVHKNTVRLWIKQCGLLTVDTRRPTLVLGAAVNSFLDGRQVKARSPCPPDHLYCVRCRAPRRPAADMVDYLPITPASGNLRAICPTCDSFMHRRVALAKLQACMPGIAATITVGNPNIGECEVAPSNSDSA